MMITKRILPRRTVLRGAGTALALPLLDAMVPALTPTAKTAAAPVKRLAFVHLPMGANMPLWTPATEGPDFQLSPTLKTLETFRDQLIVLSGLAHKQAESLGDGEGDHARSTAAWLTGTHGKRTEGADVRAGVSADQIAAVQLGEHTPLPSLELALEKNETTVGACDAGYSCVYQNTICWRDETTPLPMEIHPRAVFERLFGEEPTPERQQTQRKVAVSILDSVTEEMSSLSRRLGHEDRQIIADYVETIRGVEQRIQRAEAYAATSTEAQPERPVDIPESYEDHARLMFDLAALSFRSDMTRVMSYLIARELSVKTYPYIGVPEGHHGMSHHRDNPDLLMKQAKLNVHHLTLFAHFLENLRATPDGEGTLLDHSMVLFGSAMSNSNYHLHYDLPTLLVGGGCGQLKGGNHIRYATGTPMANLLLTLLDKADVRGVEKIGDSTGPIDRL
ncbi:MAG: DUF1552 domain-containing protein [Acidimicrobiia bacterium]|nr:DUF1552 domain-containing protein [Acidimicrobiia bacterium]